MRLELGVATSTADLESLAPGWERLAHEVAASPFESPAWLMPWWRHYGSRSGEACVLAWHAGSRLVGVAPLVRSEGRRLGRPIRELAFWAGTGSLLSGCVDLVGADADRAELLASFAAWLREPQNRWDALHFVRLPRGSGTAAAFKGWSALAGWRYLRLTGALRSRTFAIDLPADPDGWRAYLGPKARHNMRREVRLFERYRGGAIERVTDPSATDELVGALERLMAAHWGDDERYFGADRVFRAFAGEAIGGMLAAGAAYAFVARDADGVQACLANLALNRRAVAILIGVTQEPAYRPFSLGKNLFDAAMHEAVERGCSSYDLLWVGGYKESFWRARPHTLESGLLGRGVTGQAIAAYAAWRRIVRPRLGRAWRRRSRE